MAGIAGTSNDTGTTALQNLVIAFNSVNKTLQYTNGQFTSLSYPAAGLSTVRIYHGRSRAVAINITKKGGTLELYDSSEPGIIPPSSLKFALDADAALGYHQVGTEFTNGIVLVVSGTTEANVTYSVY